MDKAMALDTGFNQWIGTIAASGSLSPQFDTEGYNVTGLMLRPHVSGGTLSAANAQFRVGIASGSLVPLVDGNNNRVALPFTTTAVAYSFLALQAIRPYRYVQVETSAAQAGAVDVIIPVKAGA
jgi:hypothetical protein